MPDLPLDTLLIIGLLFASFVGNIFKKKSEIKDKDISKPTTTSPNETNEKPGDLEETLRDIWKKAFQPQEQAPVSRPLQEEDEPQTSRQRLVEKPKSKPLLKKKAVVSPATNTSQPVSSRTPSWVVNELKDSPSSIKKAFLLKEILDKPVSLRSFSE